jgi:hypothetical protein
LGYAQDECIIGTLTGENLPRIVEAGYKLVLRINGSVLERLHISRGIVAVVRLLVPLGILGGDQHCDLHGGVARVGITIRFVHIRTKIAIPALPVLVDFPEARIVLVDIVVLEVLDPHLRENPVIGRIQRTVHLIGVIGKCY